MEKLNYNKILDLTLSVLLAETPNSHIEYNSLFKQNPSLNNLVNRDKRAVIEKLLKDEYIGKMDVSNIAPNDYYITVEGILFLGSGGYVSQINKERRLIFWSYTKNVLLVLGTVSAFILACLEINEKGQLYLKSKDKSSKCKAEKQFHILQGENNKTTKVCCPK